MKAIRILAGALGFWVVVPLAARAVPKDVAPEIWVQIAPQIERTAYEFQGGSGTATARNRAQDFALAADKAGLAVDGALRLKAAALDGEALPDAPPTVSGARVEYRRGAVVEWFENCAEGLEQGFTIDQQPPTNEQLSLAVMFETELGVEVAEDGQAVLLTDEEGTVKYRYGKLHVFDAAGRTLDSCFASPATWNQKPATKSLLIVADSRNATWPITIDPVLTSMAKTLHAPDAAEGDGFGLSVAVDGDVAVVGAPSDDDLGTGSGSAYVFERNAGGTNAWGMVKKLVPADGAAYDDFGLSVAVAGDVIVVGAHWDDAMGSDSGSAYVFERNAGLKTNEWVQVAKLTAFDGATDDNFGISVAAAGDVVVVGAHGETLATGAAYVFERNRDYSTTNDWKPVKKLTASDGARSDYFGYSVAAAGDVIVAGAYGKATRAGAAYVFERNIGGTNNWGQVQKIVPLDALDDCRFGYSVAVCGDVIVGGAYGDAGVGADAGAAYVFERNAEMKTNEWRQVRKIIATDRLAGDRFGISVAVAGDVVVVGADQDDDLGNASGAAYVFERNAGGTNRWGQVQKLRHPSGAAGDGFGVAVAAGGGLILAGASGDDDLGANSGSACVFPAQREHWEVTKKLTASDGAAYKTFGWSVAAAGDVVVVGAKGDDDLGTDSGSAYVFERNAGGTNTWGQVKKLLASDGAADDCFGNSVAAAGDVVVVGADRNNDLGDFSGSVYVFERNAGGTNTWGQIKKLLASDGAADDYFGTSVAAAGDVVVVGAYCDDDLGQQSGSAYVFERNAGGTNQWGQVKKLLASDGAADDRFGNSVAAAGDVVVVGAYCDGDLGLVSGSAYVFERNAGGTNQWGQVKKLLASDGAAWEYFGNSVAAAGDMVVVGDDNEHDSAAYVYERNAGGTNAWAQVKKLVASDGADSDHFGRSVAAAGDVIAVGAYATNAAYVYEGTLFGPPTITNITSAGSSVFLSWPCQPVWLYDVEITSDLVDDPWVPAADALLNLPGNDGGSMTVEDSRVFGKGFRRLRRHAP